MVRPEHGFESGEVRFEYSRLINRYSISLVLLRMSRSSKRSTSAKS